MKRWFKNSLFTLGAMFVIAAVAIGVAVGAGEKSFLYNPMLGMFATMFCVSPLPTLIAIITGIGSLVENFSGQGKRKRDYTDFGFNDDYRMQEIMSHLSPEEQDYLQERLHNSRLGISDDGEITSLDDLFQEDEKRKNWM